MSLAKRGSHGFSPVGKKTCPTFSSVVFHRVLFALAKQHSWLTKGTSEPFLYLPDFDLLQLDTKQKMFSPNFSCDAIVHKKILTQSRGGTAVKRLTCT